MSNFVRIGTGEIFTGKLPVEVELPMTTHKEDLDITYVRTYKQGDPGWEDALYRFMFLNGYCYPEDNAREMSRDSGRQRP